MKVKGKYNFKSSRATVWDLVQDPDVLASCIPGCQQFTMVGEDTYEVVLKVGVGAVSGTYSGTTRITDKEEPSSIRLVVEGKGVGGTVKGEGLLTLEELQGQTEVTVDGDARVSGLVARVGQRILGAASKTLMDQFFSCLRARADGGQRAGAR